MHDFSLYQVHIKPSSTDRDAHCMGSLPQSTEHLSVQAWSAAWGLLGLRRDLDGGSRLGLQSLEMSQKNSTRVMTETQFGAVKLREFNNHGTVTSDRRWKMSQHTESE